MAKTDLQKLKAKLLVAEYEMLDLQARIEYGTLFSNLTKLEKFEVALNVAKRNEE